MEIFQPIVHDRHIVSELFEQMKDRCILENAFKLPSNLTIVTCRNEGTLDDRIIPQLAGYEDTSILESNCEYLGIDLEVLTDSRLPWRNTFKFEMLKNYLDSGKCETEYFLCCDAIDVIFLHDPQDAIDLFLGFGCECLFMSTNALDGYECMPDMRAWVHTINRGIERYLNSGVFIGRTEFVKEMVNEGFKYAIPHGVTMEEYSEYLRECPTDFPMGAQDKDIYRYIERKFYPKIKVDYLNRMAYRS